MRARPGGRLAVMLGVAWLSLVPGGSSGPRPAGIGRPQRGAVPEGPGGQPGGRRIGDDRPGDAQGGGPRRGPARWPRAWPRSGRGSTRACTRPSGPTARARTRPAPPPWPSAARTRWRNRGFLAMIANLPARQPERQWELGLHGPATRRHLDHPVRRPGPLGGRGRRRGYPAGRVGAVRLVAACPPSTTTALGLSPR